MAQSADRDRPVANAPDQQDVELIHAVALRDRRALEHLYYRHAGRLGRYLMRFLHQREAVEEALNDVMLVVWQNASRFDPAASRVSTWMFGIAHNKALKALASLKSRSMEVAMEPVAVDTADPQAEGHDRVEHADSEDLERTVASRQLAGTLARALEELTPEHRTVVELACGEDLSYREIATVTGAPLNTVKTRMFYARKRLGEILRRWGISDMAGL